MNTLNIVDAIKVLDLDLTRKTKVDVQMKLNNEWTNFKVSNYFASYQSQRNDLILVEVNNEAFTVSTWDAHFSIGEQIRNNVNN